MLRINELWMCEWECWWDARVLGHRGARANVMWECVSHPHPPQLLSSEGWQYRYIKYWVHRFTQRWKGGKPEERNAQFTALCSAEPSKSHFKLQFARLRLRKHAGHRSLLSWAFKNTLQIAVCSAEPSKTYVKLDFPQLNLRNSLFNFNSGIRCHFTASNFSGKFHVAWLSLWKHASHC